MLGDENELHHVRAPLLPQRVARSGVFGEVVFSFWFIYLAPFDAMPQPCLHAPLLSDSGGDESEENVS